MMAMRFLALVSTTAFLVMAPTASADATLASLTGAGPASISTAGCTVEGAIVVQLDLNGIGSLVFPRSFFTDACGGFTNAFVKDCQRQNNVIACEGSNPADARFTLTDDGVVEYETPWQGGTTFRVQGSIAYQMVVVP